MDQNEENVEIAANDLDAEQFRKLTGRKSFTKQRLCREDVMESEEQALLDKVVDLTGTKLTMDEINALPPDQRQLQIAFENCLDLGIPFYRKNETSDQREDRIYRAIRQQEVESGDYNAISVAMARRQKEEERRRKATIVLQQTDESTSSD
ncbi:MAG TPA: hypothetical protein VIH56_03225 [Candidatus Acidoferrales bacterium]